MNKGLKRRREVVSDLIIYQSQIDSSAVAEYRNVRMVDSKKVAGRDRRVQQLFGRLAKADSRKKEPRRASDKKRLRRRLRNWHVCNSAIVRRESHTLRAPLRRGAPSCLKMVL